MEKYILSPICILPRRFCDVCNYCSYFERTLTRTRETSKQLSYYNLLRLATVVYLQCNAKAPKTSNSEMLALGNLSR
jgi:hypothetical protein